MHYSESFIKNIIEQNDIVKTIEEFVTLKPKGKYLFGLCPFHSSNEPSFSVTPKKKIYYCFGCGAGGNVIQFIMKIKNIDFAAAIEYLVSKKTTIYPQIERNDYTVQIINSNDISERSKLKKDHFFVNIENNEHLINIYTHIILFFEKNYPEATIAYTKNYVGIKFKSGLNRCWFTTSGTRNFEVKFRREIDKQELEDNVVLYKVDGRKAFDALIPFIEQKMSEGQKNRENITAKKGKSFKLNDILGEGEIVKIFSIGSCNPETRHGKYQALLEFKELSRAVVGDLEDTTVNRCIITGLIEAAKILKKPCKVYLVTSTPIGVTTMIKSGKGTNADVLKELLNILKEKDCEAEFVAVEGEGDKLNSYVFSKIS